MREPADLLRYKGVAWKEVVLAHHPLGLEEARGCELGREDIALVYYRILQYAKLIEL